MYGCLIVSVGGVEVAVLISPGYAEVRPVRVYRAGVVHGRVVHVGVELDVLVAVFILGGFEYCFFHACFEGGQVGCLR